MQFRAAIAQNRRYSAQVAYVVADSRLCGVHWVFVQLPGGPLVPLAAAAGQTAGLHVGQELVVKLALQAGLIQAVMEPADDLRREVNLPKREMASSQTPPPAAVEGPSPVREGKVVPFSRPAAHGAAPSTTRDIPRNAVVDAKVERLSSEVFIARVTTAAYQGTEKQLEYPSPGPRSEVRVGRSLRFRMEEGSKGRFVEWTDRQQPMDFPQRWPVGTLLKVEVVGPHPEKSFLVTVRMPQLELNYPWLAYTGKTHAQEARPGRSMQVTVTKWLTERRDPWPHLQFRQWLA